MVYKNYIQVYQTVIYNFRIIIKFIQDLRSRCQDFQQVWSLLISPKEQVIWIEKDIIVQEPVNITF